MILGFGPRQNSRGVEGGGSSGVLDHGKVGPPAEKMFPQEEQPRQGEVVRTTSANKPLPAQGGHTLRE